MTTDPTWEFNFKLPEGEIPQGMYKTKIIKATPEATGDRYRVSFDFKIVLGDFMGAVINTTLLLPNSSSDKVLHYWRQLAVSVGFQKDEIRSRTQWRKEDFLGKNAYLFFRPQSEKNKYQFVRYITEYQFSTTPKTQSKKEVAKPVVEEAKQTLPPPEPVSKPTGFGGISKLKGLASK